MTKEALEKAVLEAAGDGGIGTILFRNSLARKLGLGLTESLCLTLLGLKKASSPSELARWVGLTTGATTTMLDRLEKRGFIRRAPNPDDRRGVVILLDEDYGRIARGLVSGIQEAHRRLISRYSEQELEVIADFLRGFARNLTEGARELEPLPEPDRRS